MGCGAPLLWVGRPMSHQQQLRALDQSSRGDWSASGSWLTSAVECEHRGEDLHPLALPRNSLFPLFADKRGWQGRIDGAHTALLSPGLHVSAHSLTTSSESVVKGRLSLTTHTRQKEIHSSVVEGHLSSQVHIKTQYVFFFFLPPKQGLSDAG